MLVVEIRVARLNLTQNIMSSKTMHNSDIAIQMLIDDAYKSMEEEFYAKTYDFKIGDVYLQAEYTPIDLSESSPIDTSYSLNFSDLTLKFNKVSSEIESIDITYPQFGTDYLNYFVVNSFDELKSNRVNNTYLSKSQVLKKYNKNYSETSYPRLYKGEVLSKQFSINLDAFKLKKALYLDMAESDSIYNIKYPIYEAPTSKTLDNTKYTISNIAIPEDYKEVYIVFCNENKPLPTGLFDDKYTYGTDIATLDVRDNIRRMYSYIRIYKNTNTNKLVIENSIPIHEQGFQYTTIVGGPVNASITNMKANMDIKEDTVINSNDKLDTVTGENNIINQSAAINSVSGLISLATGNRARQIINLDNIPTQITYELKIPTKRQFKISYRIFNSKNILIKSKEYILEMKDR